MAIATATHPLVSAIASALDAGDRDALAALYAADAVYRSLGPAHPPAAPLVLEGAAARDYVRSIPAEIRMSMRDHMVGTDGRVAFRTRCDFPGGGAAVTFHLLELDDAGRIRLHESVEVQDA